MALEDYYKVKHTSFKQKCLDLYGKDFGLVLYKFYYNHIDFGGGKKFGKLIKRRMMHIKDTVLIYSESEIRKAIDIVVANIKKGKTRNTESVTPGYFEAVLAGKNEYQSDTKPKQKKRGRGTPIFKEKARTEYDDDFFNWDYTCPECEGDVTPWDVECQNQKCRTWFDWDKVNI